MTFRKKDPVRYWEVLISHGSGPRPLKRRFVAADPRVPLQLIVRLTCDLQRVVLGTCNATDAGVVVGLPVTAILENALPRREFIIVTAHWRFEHDWTPDIRHSPLK